MAIGQSLFDIESCDVTIVNTVSLCAN